MPVKVVIVEDQELTSEAFYKLLSASNDIRVMARVKTGDEAIDASKIRDLDVMLMDIELAGDKTGIDAAEIIKTQNSRVKILFLSTYIKKKYVQKVLKTKPDGFISKNISGSYLIESIKKIYSGQGPVYCNEVLKIIPSCFEPEAAPEVNATEKAIICLTVQGFTVKQIAGRIHKAYFTVETYRKKLYQKLNLKNAMELVAWAKDNNICKEFQTED